MAATNKKIDAIRRLILGPLYGECQDNPLGVKRDVLEERFEELKKEGCVGADCGFDELIKVCQLKSHYPTCLSDDRNCIEGMGERSTGIRKFYYDQYKRAKAIEDEADESSSDEEDEIECPTCLMNEDENGIRLVETVENPEEEQGPLSCGHLVHKSCLIREAQAKNKNRATCPLCFKVFYLEEVPVPVENNEEERTRDALRRNVHSAAQMTQDFRDVAATFETDVDTLLERLGMTPEEASRYFNIPIERIVPPVNRRLDFDDEDDDIEAARIRGSVFGNIIQILRHIRAGDIEEAITVAEEKIEEEGNNAWVAPDIIREILSSILNFDRRRDLDNLLGLFILVFHNNIINDSNNMEETIANSIVQMFRASTTKKGIAKLILLHIIKTDSIGIYYILLNILKGYDDIAITTENEVITFIFEAYNGFTERNEPVAELFNETDGNTVLKYMLNDIFEDDGFRRWRNMTDVSTLIRGWLRQYFPGEVEFESDNE
jgi:hypothetical protein